MMANEYSFTVAAAESGERIDKIAAARFPELSRSHLQKLISGGKVLRNGRNASKSDRLNENDAIEITGTELYRDPSSAPVPQEIPVPVLFEDEHLVVIDKPPGLVVHPGNGNPDGTLVNALLYKIGTLSGGSAAERPGIVHRLDKDTSGILVVAKTDQAHAALAAAFSGRQVRKEYAGFCIGARPESHGTIELPLGRSRRDPLRRAVMDNGKPALTEYWCLDHRSGISAVRFRLHTGRTHQIRVHCSSKGFPIVHDELYGGGKDRIARIPPLDRPFAHAIFKCFTRHALHAFYISLIHPFTKKEFSITAPLPEDFRKACTAFGDEQLFGRSAGLDIQKS